MIADPIPASGPSAMELIGRLTRAEIRAQVEDLERRAEAMREETRQKLAAIAQELRGWGVLDAMAAARDGVIVKKARKPRAAKTPAPLRGPDGLPPTATGDEATRGLIIQFLEHHGPGKPAVIAATILRPEKDVMRILEAHVDEFRKCNVNGCLGWKLRE